MFIQSSRQERSLWPRIAAPLIAGILFSLVNRSPAQSAPAVYVVADQDGYGVMECLTQKSTCSKIVADAWCVAHGHATAHAFGRAEDVTAAIAAVNAPAPLDPNAAVISCGD
jgi:hypothetical protein